MSIHEPDLPKLRTGNLVRQINLCVEADLRSMFDYLRENQINASEIARRAMRKAFEDACERVRLEGLD